MPAGLALLRDANVRRAVPSTTAPIATVLKAGAAYPAVGITSGERVAGNSYWYCDANRNFLWAGATNFPNGA
jgi:hypothetical protein